MPGAIAALTIVHVAISLIAIVLGLPAMLDILKLRNASRVVLAFILFTALTSITGFAFPITRFTPGLAFGILTILLLVLAWTAFHRAPHSINWQSIYLWSLLATLYLNCVVLVVQSFQKIEPLKSLAPTQTEWPFLVAQLLMIVPFVALIRKSISIRRMPARCD